MLKLKIYLTVFVLYEIAAVLLLHFPSTCDAMFAYSFCADSVFKYFIACFVIPALAFLIIMWIMHIIGAVRRRHSLMYKAKTAVKDIVSSVSDRVSESVSAKDLEKMIIGAVVVGVKKYVAAHPNTRRAFGNLIDMVDGGEYDIDAEYEYTDDDEEQSSQRSSGRQSATRNGGNNRQTRSNLTGNRRRK